jgi:hypothetical protein
MGIRSFVGRMSAYASVLSFGFGALIASAPGAFGRVREPAPAQGAGATAYRDTPPRPAAPVDGDATAVRTGTRETTRV